MSKIWQYVSTFLAGALVIAIAVLIYLLKNVKPIINADTLIEDLNQSVKKLKQSGQGNSQNIKPIVDINNEEQIEEKPKKFLGIFKRKSKN